MATALSTTRRACLPSEGFCSRKSKDRMRSSWGASDQHDRQPGVLLPRLSGKVVAGQAGYAKVEDGDIHIARRNRSIACSPSARTSTSNPIDRAH